MVLAPDQLCTFLALPLHVYGTLWTAAIAYLIRYLGTATSCAASVQLSRKVERDMVPALLDSETSWTRRVGDGEPGPRCRSLVAVADFTLPLAQGHPAP